MAKVTRKGIRTFVKSIVTSIRNINFGGEFRKEIIRMLMFFKTINVKERQF